MGIISGGGAGGAVTAAAIEATFTAAGQVYQGTGSGTGALVVSPLGVVSVRGVSDAATYSTTSTTLVDVDATNLAITFTAPPSGKVIVLMNALCNGAGNNVFFGLRAGASVVAGSSSVMNGVNGTLVGTCVLNMTGLSGSLTWKMAFAVAAATLNLYSGPTFGSITMAIFPA